jgi:ABC-2 type transport system ATP-binding protein
MIQVNQLTKRYGTKLAVDQLSFQVRPGRVTGFLGPNGAGKSTTMRLILGLDAPLHYLSSRLDHRRGEHAASRAGVRLGHARTSVLSQR